MLKIWALNLWLCIWAAVFGLIKTVMLRKEIRNLTEQEWDDYMDAILIYKYEGRRDVSLLSNNATVATRWQILNQGKDYMINYDHMVAQHAIASMNSTVNDCSCWYVIWFLFYFKTRLYPFYEFQCDQAHEWAAFIIWHSIFVREFEIALQSINPNVSVPYWWVLVQYLKALFMTLWNDYFVLGTGR